MRHSVHLRTTKKTNILKRRFESGVSSVLIAIGVAMILVLIITYYSRLSLTGVFGGFVISLTRTTIAYIIALTLALSIALLITSHEKVENVLLPVFDSLQSFPSFALFPVLIEALKRSPEAVIILVLSVTMIWPMLFSIIGGMKNRREDLEEAATIFGARGAKRLWHFTLPELLPSIITGSIVGWGEGWEFIIGAELLVKVNTGIGSYLGFLGENHENWLLALGIIVLMILLLVINRVIWLPLLKKATEYGTEA